ncbi:major royal jelly protein [Burkholderia pyrrocinia]|nr:major royal jelly protein [Burkholderia pyrrocinia]
MLRSIVFFYRSLCGAGVLFAALAASAGAPDDPSRTVAAQLETVRTSSQMPWNAVAVDSRSRIIVSAPIWAGNIGPAVAVAEPDGALIPWPSREWNSWRPGADATHTFVSVNALHVDADGSFWVVDTGAPLFGGAIVPGGAKVVHVDANDDKVLRIYPIPAAALRANSYVDDIRLNGRRAYLTDAGAGALMVLNLDSGAVRRRFDDEHFTKARPEDLIVVNGKVLSAPDGAPLHVNADDLELSVDGRYFYFAPLSGPMYRIETRYLDDETLADAQLAQHVVKWFDLPAVGGTAMARDGTLYYTQLDENALMRRSPDGSVALVARDSRLRWVDAPFLDGKGNIYLPAAQLDGAAVFNNGRSTMKMPIHLYKLKL